MSSSSISGSSSSSSSSFTSPLSPQADSSKKRKEPSTPSNPLAGRVTETPSGSPITPHVATFSILPGTVLRPSAQASHAPGDPFSNKQLAFQAVDLSGLPTPDDLQAKYFTQRVYTQNGVTRNLYKQIQTKDCGAICLLMLFSDISRSKVTPIATERPFWDALVNISLANGDTLKNVGSKGSVSLEVQRVPMENPLQYLKNLIKSSGFPVISSITHEVLSGHWVVVDEVKDTETLIRDPNTGNAYAVPNTVMESYYTDDEEEECAQTVLFFNGFYNGCTEQTSEKFGVTP